MTISLNEAMQQKLALFVETREYDAEGRLSVSFREVMVSPADLRRLGIELPAKVVEVRTR